MYTSAMTRSTAIDQEREQLDAMIHILKLEVDGEPAKRERPDFVIRLRGGRSIGVELVRALDEQVASGRGTRSRIKRQVCDALKAAGINAWVNVRLHENIAGHLNGKPDLLRREIAAIVSLARDVMGRQHEDRSYHYERDADELEGTGIEYADAVAIHSHEEPMVTWSLLGDGQRSDIVQNAIDDKAQQLATYRQCGADEIWLLVIGSAGTGGALFVDDVDYLMFTSPFDRTVFLELFEGKCVVLNTAPPAAP